MSAPDNNSTPFRRFLKTSEPSISRSAWSSSARRSGLHFSRTAVPGPGSRREDDNNEHRPLKHGSSPSLENHRVFGRSQFQNPLSPYSSSVQIDDEDFENDASHAELITYHDDGIDNDVENSSGFYLDHGKQTDGITPNPKRRKIVRLNQPVKDPIIIPISPSTSDQDLDYDEEHATQLQKSNPKIDDTLPEITPLRMKSRFKVTVAHPRPYESPQPKLSFRSPQRQSQDPMEATNATLPEAFSPSRRKGKKEYIRGGAAETVRNWILDAASRESSIGPRNELTISVATVSKDKHSHFASVMDETGTRWLLIGQKCRNVAFSSPNIAAIRSGIQIVIRGLATKWPLILDEPPNLEELLVAVDWRIQK